MPHLQTQKQTDRQKDGRSHKTSSRRAAGYSTYSNYSNSQSHTLTWPGAGQGQCPDLHANARQGIKSSKFQLLLELRLAIFALVPALAGRFLVRIFILAWAPRGLPGPGFRLPWPAGGQVGWPSRWEHLGRPDGRSAACRRRRHVRFRPPPPAGCPGGQKLQVSTQGAFSTIGRGGVRPA